MEEEDIGKCKVSKVNSLKKGGWCYINTFQNQDENHSYLKKCSNGNCKCQKYAKKKFILNNYFSKLSSFSTTLKKRVLGNFLVWYVTMLRDCETCDADRDPWCIPPSKYLEPSFGVGNPSLLFRERPANDGESTGGNLALPSPILCLE